MQQIRYKTDLKCFQTYRTNKIAPDDTSCINTKDHSTYLEVVHVDPRSVIGHSVFSVAAYRATFQQQGGDVAKFDKEVGTNFKKGAKGSWAPDPEKVPVDRVMLVCQRENGVDVAYSDPDGFGHPSTMGLWDLHSPDALSRAKMQLSSGLLAVTWVLECPWSPLMASPYRFLPPLQDHVSSHRRIGHAHLAETSLNKAHKLLR